MPTPIPEEIEYLSSVIDKLSEFDPETLGGDNPEAMDLVEEAIGPIIDAMSDSEATEATFPRIPRTLSQSLSA